MNQSLCILSIPVNSFLTDEEGDEMAEIGIGVLFAVWFITVYLLVSRLRKRRQNWPGRVTLNPLDTTNALEAPGQKRLLTTAEMSEHHAPGKGSSPTEK